MTRPTDYPPELPDIPPDFEQRYAEAYCRLHAGEQMSYQQVADLLGLPYEFLVTVFAIYCATTSRAPVVVDYSHPPSLH